MEEKLIELLANYPNQRVDFQSEEGGEEWSTEWKGKFYEWDEFCIYRGSSWEGSENCIVNSIYADDDFLCFDLLVFGWDGDGNYFDGEVRKDVTLFDIEQRTNFKCQRDRLDRTLSLFAEIL
jgi:hypothetical protein